MSDIQLNEFGDIELVNGKVSLITSEEELIKQKLSITFRTYQGEWFLDTTAGLPYTQTILRKGTSKALVDSIIYKAIIDYEEVQSITSFESTIKLGVYSVLFTAIVVNGDIITVNQDLITD